MPEFPYTDVIRNFSKSPLNITYEDLYKLKDFIKENEFEEIKTDKKSRSWRPQVCMLPWQPNIWIVEDFPIFHLIDRFFIKCAI